MNSSLQWKHGNFYALSDDITFVPILLWDHIAKFKKYEKIAKMRLDPAM